MDTSDDDKIIPAYFIPLKYGGACCGLNCISTIGCDVKSQTKYFKSLKKKNKEGGLSVHALIRYVGASEIPTKIEYQ